MQRPAEVEGSKFRVALEGIRVVRNGVFVITLRGVADTPRLVGVASPGIARDGSVVIGNGAIPITLAA